MTSEQLASLQDYSACDISDALLKLKVPSAGFIPDLLPYAPHQPHSASLPSQPKLVGPAFPVLFAAKEPPAPGVSTTIQLPPANIPAGTHYVDLTPAGSIAVLSQPEGQKCAVLGGIMAARMRACGAKGAVVGGRIRDLRELRSLNFPVRVRNSEEQKDQTHGFLIEDVFAHATSTVGTAAEAKPHAINVVVTVSGTVINPGDIIFADALEGVVVIPSSTLPDVLAMLPAMIAADEKVLADVKAGVSGVRDAFAKYRGKL